MKHLFLLCCFLFSAAVIKAQFKDNVIVQQSVDPLPMKIKVDHPMVGLGPKNNHRAGNTAAKQTSGTTTHADWYDLWDEMFDTTYTTLPHSYSYIWAISPDSNIHDLSGYYAPYYMFTHGMGMSFDPSDSAYYYHAFDTSYRVSAPFDFRLPYQLDSFWFPGEYYRYDTTFANVDSIIVEFLVTQNGGLPDSGAYALIASSPAAMYRPFTHDSTPRFATARYFNATDNCIDPLLTKTAHQRFAFPLTAFDPFTLRHVKFNLPTPITVPPGKYLVAYIYFKSQVTYPVGTSSYASNYYWLFAGEPNGTSNWFPQSARNIGIGFPGSHQNGLIATNQIRYNNTGFVFNSHNVLIPASAYANTGANLPPGFTVPQMSFHITWSETPSLAVAQPSVAAPSVTAYPNPASGRLNFLVDNTGGSDGTLSLFNMIGQEVATRNITGAVKDIYTIDTRSFPGGVYSWQLVSNNSRTTGKIDIIH